MIAVCDLRIGMEIWIIKNEYPEKAKIHDIVIQIGHEGFPSIFRIITKCDESINVDDAYESEQAALEHLIDNTKAKEK